MKKVDVSIVICTHRRFDLLAGAVQSLVNQTASPDSYEVIVVDNDHQPNLEVQEIVSNARPKIFIKYLNESKLGLSHARNAGGKLATSDYIGYMDDDAKANPKYIETLIKVLNERSPTICGGPYYPFYLDPKPKWFLDRYGSSSFGDEPRYLTSREYLSGMNIVFQRDLLDEVAWFDPALGMTGKKIWYGEETIVMINAWKAYPDLKVYYDPELFVYHLVPAWKMRIWNLMKIGYQKGKSHAYLWIPEDKHDFFRRRAPYNLMISLLYLGRKIFPGIISHDRKKYPFWQNYVIEEVPAIIERIGHYTRLSSDFSLFFLERLIWPICRNIK